MIPVISVPNVQATPPVQASVVTAAQSNIAIGSLPATFVAPSIAVPEPSNDRKNAPATRSLFAPPVASLVFPSEPAALQRSPASLQLGFVSSFVAQMLGQSSESEGKQLVTFFNSDSSPPIKSESGNSITFSLLPFQPSLAALPKEVVATIRSAAGERVVPAPVKDEGDNTPSSPTSGERITTSLLGGKGDNAYLSTMARNAINLSPDFHPQFEVTL